jgi:predicted heme/steroid binding protein
MADGWTKNNGTATMSGIPNPSTLMSPAAGASKADLPAVEQLGIISVETLNQYDCHNARRQCLSLFGVVYDVTSAASSYGPDGAYKEYAGHDITLALAKSKTEAQWLDRFVCMEQEWIDSVKGWVPFYQSKYPTCGQLDMWVNAQLALRKEVTDRGEEASSATTEAAEESDSCRYCPIVSWPALTDEEKQELEQGCCIM